MQEQEQMKCPQCGRSFSSQEDLDRHIQEEHGGMDEGGMGTEETESIGE